MTAPKPRIRKKNWVVDVYFGRWLTLMELAFAEMTKSEFRQLEEKIKSEIRYHRRKKAA